MYHFDEQAQLLNKRYILITVKVDNLVKMCIKREITALLW